MTVSMAVTRAVLLALLSLAVTQTDLVDGATSNSEEEAASLYAAIPPQLICDVFGPGYCNTALAPSKCPCDEGASNMCECMPYPECDNSTGEPSNDGRGILTFKQQAESCPSDQFCSLSQRRPTKGVSETQPDTTVSPDSGPTADSNKKKVLRCGVYNEDGLVNKISGPDGEILTFPGEVTWMAAVLLRKDDGSEEFKCGGVLVATNIVLTAAHCVIRHQSSQKRRKLRVRLGEYDLETTEEALASQERSVSEVVVHKDFNINNFANNMALLVLDTPVQPVAHIGVVCLPEASDGQVFEGKECFVSGWGKKTEDDAKPQRQLKKGDFTVMPKQPCQDHYRGVKHINANFTIHHSVLCARSKSGHGTCKRDGGSPLACRSPDGSYQVAGLVSFGLGCETGEPELYANVASARVWLDTELGKRPEPTQPSPPPKVNIMSFGRPG